MNRQFRHPIWRNHMIWCGVAILAAIVMFAVLAPLISSGDPNRMAPRLRNLGPSWDHPFGADALGRDLFLRVAYGSRASLAMAFAVSFVTLVVGATLGAIAGYAGGWIDATISAVNDGLMAFPSILLALGVMAALGASVENIVIALSLVYIPRVARVTRAPVIAQKGQDYVQAARSVGASHVRVLCRHILPNVTSPIIVQVTVIFAYALVGQAALDFLGMGTPPPDATWGTLLSEGRRTILSAPTQTLFPALAFGATVLAINLLGDGLRDALDPQLRHEGAAVAQRD